MGVTTRYDGGAELEQGQYENRRCQDLQRRRCSAIGSGEDQSQAFG